MTDRPRILVSFPFAKKGGWFIPLGEGCAGALEQLGFDVLRFNPVVEALPRFFGQKLVERLAVLVGRLLLQPKAETKRRLPWSDEAIYCRRILKFAEHTRPDYLLVISTNTYPATVLRKLRKQMGVKRLVGWCIEGPTWKRSVAVEAVLYDSYFRVSAGGDESASRVPTLSALAYDPANYSPIHPRPAKQIDVTFVGIPKPRRVEFLRTILDFRPLVYGPNWATACSEIAPYVGGEQISGAELNRLYNNCKVVLNISQWDNNKSDCPNLRIVDVPASGSFLLSDYSASAAELFVEGQEIEFFRSPGEMREKLEFYLKNDIARERIAHRGYEKARSLQTYLEKMRCLLQASRIELPIVTRP